MNDHPMFDRLDRSRTDVVLIVDDVPDNLSLLHDALDDGGYTVLVATHGEAALQRASQAVPDIILLEDFQGSGQAPFAELLANTAVQDVPAIANQNVHLIAMTEASSLAGINLPVGYRKIAELIAQ